MPSNGFEIKLPFKVPKDPEGPVGTKDWVSSCAKAGEQSSPWEGEERGQFGGRIGRIKKGVKHPQKPPKLCETVQKEPLN